MVHYTAIVETGIPQRHQSPNLEIMVKLMNDKTVEKIYRLPYGSKVLDLKLHIFNDTGHKISTVIDDESNILQDYTKLLEMVHYTAIVEEKKYICHFVYWYFGKQTTRTIRVSGKHTVDELKGMFKHVANIDQTQQLMLSVDGREITGLIKDIPEEKIDVTYPVDLPKKTLSKRRTPKEEKFIRFQVETFPHPDPKTGDFRNSIFLKVRELTPVYKMTDHLKVLLRMGREKEIVLAHKGTQIRGVARDIPGKSISAIIVDHKK